MKVIEFKHVWKKFRVEMKKGDTLKESFVNLMKNENSFIDIWALKDVSFELKRGESLGIVGENASGKTTLLKLVAGILKPTRGRVRTTGKIASVISLGVGFENELTARENVYLYGSLLGLSKREIEEKYPSIVEFSELQDYMDAKLRTFSSGMKMRLAFAVLAHADIDILLMDEIFSVGDGAFQKKCLDVMSDLKNQEKNIILVSHNLNNIRAISDRVMFLHHGRIRGLGSVDEVLSDYESFLSSKRIASFNKRRLLSLHSGVIKNVEFIGKRGEFEYTVKAHEPLKVTIEFNKEVRNNIFELCFYDESGANTIKLYSKTFNNRKVEFNIERLPLPAGTYDTYLRMVGKKKSFKLLRLGVE